MMIPFVLLEVVPKVVDSLGEKGNLNRRTSPVAFVELLFLDQCVSFYRCDAAHDLA